MDKPRISLSFLFFAYITVEGLIESKSEMVKNQEASTD